MHNHYARTAYKWRLTGKNKMTSVSLTFIKLANVPKMIVEEEYLIFRSFGH